MLHNTKDYNYQEDPKSFLFVKEDINDLGEFTGYASTFGGKPDNYGDIIVDGSFTDTIIKGGKFKLGIKMLYQHDSYTPIGLYPDLNQNKTGLKVKGKIEMGTQKGNETHVLMKAGIINALSIGWEPLREDAKGRSVSLDEAMTWDDDKGNRYLKMIDLWEISPVTFPANNRAIITDVKFALEHCKSVRQLEQALRELGLTNSAAKYIAGMCKYSLNNEKTYAGDDLKVILGKIKSINTDLAIGGLLKSINIPSVQCEASTENK